MDGRGSEGPRHPALWSACSVVFAAVVASVVFVNLHGGLLFCTTERSHGANVDRALGIAFWAGIGALLVIPCVHTHRRVLAVVLLCGAAALGAAMVFLAVDSATFVATNSCGLIDETETTVNEHLYYLFVLWGAPFGVLCWFARGLWANHNAAPAPRPAYAQANAQRQGGPHGHFAPQGKDA
jgi:hypothetical protein